MAHIVDENCIDCLHKKCVLVCPVNCFHLGRNMVVIDPSECIDCGLCIESCPTMAIRGLADPSPKAHRNPYWAAFNRHYSVIWPRISDIEEELSTERQKSPSYFIRKEACLLEDTFVPSGCGQADPS